MGSSNTSDIIDQYVDGFMNEYRLVEEMQERDNEITSMLLNDPMRVEDEASVPQRRTRKHIVRDRLAANERLMQDYFNDPCTYDDTTFRRRFRMSRRLFLRIVGDLEREYPHFQQLPDGRGKLGFTGIQKCTSALRVLAYGNTSDINDDYLKMAEKTTRDALEHFYTGIIQLYGDRYLRTPTTDDLMRLYEAHEEKHSFPGMIGSIDCMHREWSNCLTAWRGQYTRGDHGHPTVALQVICSQDLWVWLAFFGSVGSNNDINVLKASPMLEHYINRNIAVFPFVVNGAEYEHGYYLGDGIYPEYSIIVRTFTNPIDEKRRYFKKRQEGARKDIERCFGVLQQRWHYVRNPCRAMSVAKMSDAMYTCIILHNMILEDEGRAICQDYIPDIVPEQFPHPTIPQRRRNQRELESKQIHSQLRADLVEHVWARRPDNYQDKDEDEYY